VNTLKNTHGIAHVYLDGDCDEGIEGYFNLFADEVNHPTRRAALGDRIVIEPPGPRVQYLVTIATSRDDLPAKLCDSEFEVREHIAEVERSQDITFEAPDAFPVLPGYLLNLCGRDCPNSVYGFDIWRFEGGAPVRHVVLHGDSGAAERLSSIPAEFFGEGRS